MEGWTLDGDFATWELVAVLPISGHLSAAGIEQVDPERVRSNLDRLDHLPPHRIDNRNRIALPVSNVRMASAGLEN
jgi:hypothetical protein